MSRKYTLFTVVVSFIYSVAIAQKIQLDVGDVMPDLSIPNLVNREKKSVTISEYKGKLLILDFWATWCAPCVAMMPKTATLEKKFEGKVEFLPITFQDAKVVEPFLTKFNKANHCSIYSATGDSSIQKLFYGANVLPTYVWINDKGIIIGITSLSAINESTIEGVLDGTIADLPSRRRDLSQEIRTTPKNDQPFLIGSMDKEGNTAISSNLFCSAFSLHQEGSTTFFTMLTKPFNGFRVANYNLSWLYRMAFGKAGYEFMDPERLSWEVQDSMLNYMSPGGMWEIFRTNRNAYQQWKRSNEYCYELHCPEYISPDQKWEIMQRDLNNYFGALHGLQGAREKRKVKCLVLVRTSKMDKIGYAGPVEEGKDAGDYTIPGILYNWMKFKGYTGRPPLVDGTNYKGRAKIELNIASLKNLEAVNAELKKYEVKLIEDVREIDMMVIKKARVTK